MKKYLLAPRVALISLLPFGSLTVLSACDVPSSLSTRTPTADALTLRAAILTTATGQNLRILDTRPLPDSFQNSTQLQAILDNSNTVYTFERNADGSLSMPLPDGRRPDSEGKIELLITNGTQSQLVILDTSPLVNLQSEAIQVTPGNNVTLGTELKLTAQFDADFVAEEYILNWSVATSANGTFQPLSGNQATISWTPTQAGNYFIRLIMQNKATGASSTYTTPAPLIFVNGTDQLLRTLPASGQILTGDRLTLEANFPEAENQTGLLWSFSQSPVGPFQPIAETGQSIRWEPPAAGSYYLRIQVPQADGSLNAYTSSQALVQVSNPDNLVRTQPESGEIIRGEQIQLETTLQDLPEGTEYLWSYSNSAQGPFRAIASEGPQIQWTPEETGEFYLRLRTLIPREGSELKEEKTYTTSGVEVSVRDTDSTFALSPQPANLLQGQSVTLALANPPATGSTISWAFAPSPQGPFQSISGTGGANGQGLRWSPPAAGNFFLRAEVTRPNGSNRTFTSASALVNVAQSSGVITTSAGQSNLGQAVRLEANLPEPMGNEIFTWSVSPSPAGPWQIAQSLDSDTGGAQLNWYPPQEGTYYIKTDVYQPTTQEVMSFVSPRALVQVTNQPSFFRTSPEPANIGIQGAVILSANFFTPSVDRFSYAWSRSNAPMGPFTALGGSLESRFNWVQPGIPGNYYIKLDVIAESTRKNVSFTSTNPIVFVGESQSQTTSRF